MNFWVTSYKIHYSLDGITWLSYENDRIFEANNDATSVKVNQLTTPLKARAIRIIPIEWNNYIGMRAEVYIHSANH